MAVKTMDTVVRLMGQIDPSLAKSLQGAQSQFKKLNKVQLAVNGAFIAMGAVAIKSMVDASKKAIEFQKQMSNVATLLDGDVNKRIAQLNKEVIKVSNTTGAATSDLTNGLYQVVSAFGDSAEASKQLEIAAKAAVAGNATTTEAINMLSAVTKGYGDTSAVAQQKAADLAFQTVKLGQTTFPELAASMGKVIPLAATMGIKQEELFGAMATLTGVTGATAEVTTQLRGAVQGFLQPTESMTQAIQALGYANGQEMIKAVGLQKSLLMLKTAVGGNEIAFSNLFGSIEAKNAVLALTGAQVEDMERKTKAMYEASGIASEAFKRQKDNAVALGQDIQNLINNGLMELGIVILPIIKGLLQLILPLVQALADHSEILIPIIAGVCAALASFSVLQSVITLMEIWKASTIAATLANGGLVAALKAVWVAMTTNPIGWICIAIGALIAIVVALVSHWDQVKNAVLSFWNTTQSVCISLWATITDVFGKIGTFLKDNFINIILMAMGPLGMIIKGVQAIGNGIRSFGGSGKNKEIPQLAAGGFTNGISIAGESGREAVISFNPAYRSDNISTWLKAGELLGISSGSSNSYNLGGFTFSPQLYIRETMNGDEIISRLKNAEGEFLDLIEEYMARKTLMSYSSNSMAY